MNQTGEDEPELFGFLSIAELPGDAILGGYLLVDSLGRPTEFHCTEPVAPNRAQKILYGNTLKPFLYAERVAASLVAHASCRPSLLCSDSTDVSPLQRAVDCPVLMVGEPAKISGGRHTMRPIEIASKTWWTSCSQPDSAIQQLIDEASELDLNEPFQRIHEALSELQKAA